VEECLEKEFFQNFINDKARPYEMEAKPKPKKDKITTKNKRKRGRFVAAIAVAVVEVSSNNSMLCCVYVFVSNKRMECYKTKHSLIQ